SPLDKEKLWDFTPIVEAGDKVIAGNWLGQVTENHQPHKIKVPFVFKGEYVVKSVAKAGDYKIEQTVAVLTDSEGNDIDVNMIQKWPVKRPIKSYNNKPRPF